VFSNVFWNVDDPGIKVRVAITQVSSRNKFFSDGVFFADKFDDFKAWGRTRDLGDKYVFGIKSRCRDE